MTFQFEVPWPWQKWLGTMGYFFKNAKVLPRMLQLFNFLSLFAFSAYT